MVHKRQKREKYEFLVPKTFEEFVDLEPNRLVTQAERVISKFGGIVSFTKSIQQVGYSVHKTTIYRWVYPTHNPKHKDPNRKTGLGGVLPASVIPYLQMAANLEGITLTSEDLDPRALPKRVVIE